MSVTIKIDEARILGRLQNPEFGTFISSEWKRLIDPYTPRDTGQLMGEFGHVAIEPFKLHYLSDYAAAVYYNRRGVTFKTVGTGRNPYATDHWDIKAANAGQLDKLYQIINGRLRGE